MDIIVAVASSLSLSACRFAFINQWLRAIWGNLWKIFAI
jgi:hypothetical protein